MTDKERFWSKVNKKGRPPAHNKSMGNCWLWTGYMNDVYPVLRWGRIAQYGAHRISWELAKKQPPGPKNVRRVCGNPACIRPAHLSAVKKGDWSPGYPHKIFKGVCAGAILNVRRQYATGRYSQKSLAEMVGMSRSAVGSIVRRETWKEWVPS